MHMQPSGMTIALLCPTAINLMPQCLSPLLYLCLYILHQSWSHIRVMPGLDATFLLCCTSACTQFMLNCYDHHGDAFCQLTTVNLMLQLSTFPFFHAHVASNMKLCNMNVSKVELEKIHWLQVSFI